MIAILISADGLQTRQLVEDRQYHLGQLFYVATPEERPWSVNSLSFWFGGHCPTTTCYKCTDHQADGAPIFEEVL